MAAAIVIPLALALAGAICLLVAQNRATRRPVPTRHLFRGQGEAVTVAELLDNTLEQGKGAQLNWSADDEARADSRWRGLRPYVQDQMGTEFISKNFSSESDFPTEILPRVDGPDENEL